MNPSLSHSDDHRDSRQVLRSVTNRISSIVLTRGTPAGWWIGFLVAFALVNVLLVSIAYLLTKGIGI